MRYDITVRYKDRSSWKPRAYAFSTTIKMQLIDAIEEGRKRMRSFDGSMISIHVTPLGAKDEQEG